MASIIQELSLYGTKRLLDILGLPCLGKGDRDESGTYIDFTPQGFDYSESFAVRFRINWKSLECQFIPGKFSKMMIAAMGRNVSFVDNICLNYFNILKTQKIEIRLKINGVEYDSLHPENWAMDWEHFNLTFRLFPFDQEEDNPDIIKKYFDLLVIPFFAILISLIGIDEENSCFLGETEGAVVIQNGVTYERKRINRDLCIRLKGTQCLVCGFDFGKKYGEKGYGFIEIHHIKPVATLAADYRIDIIRDLVPLCSNCHSMVHTETPPIEIEELKKSLV